MATILKVGNRERQQPRPIVFDLPEDVNLNEETGQNRKSGEMGREFT